MLRGRANPRRGLEPRRERVRSPRGAARASRDARERRRGRAHVPARVPRPPVPSPLDGGGRARDDARAHSGDDSSTSEGEAEPTTRSERRALRGAREIDSAAAVDHLGVEIGLPRFPGPSPSRPHRGGHQRNRSEPARALSPALEAALGLVSGETVHGDGRAALRMHRSATAADGGFGAFADPPGDPFHRGLANPAAGLALGIPSGGDGHGGGKAFESGAPGPRRKDGKAAEGGGGEAEEATGAAFARDDDDRSDASRRSARRRHAKSLSVALSVDEDNCPVCFEAYSAENPAMPLTCGHRYHLGCIYEWYERSELCPICEEKMAFDPSTGWSLDP